MYAQPIDNDTIADALNDANYLQQLMPLPGNPKLSFVQLQLGRISRSIRECIDPYEIDAHYRNRDMDWLAKHLRIGYGMMLPIVEGILDIVYESDLRDDGHNREYAASKRW